MKKQILSILFLAILHVLVISCKEQLLSPELELTEDVINVTASGGFYSISYTITNPTEEASLSIDNQPEWVSDFNFEKQGVISFFVHKNELTEERSAKLNLVYSGIEEVLSFTIIQEAASVPPFSINVNEVSEIYVNLDIIPEDKEMTYINFTMPREYESYYENDDALFNDDMAYFQSLSDAYNLPIDEVIETYVRTGDLTDQTLSGLIPGTEYMTYVYGIDTQDNTRTTEIVREYYYTADVEQIDVDFDFDYEINGGFVNVSIIPQNYDGYFSYEVYGGVTEDMDIDKLCEENWINTVSFFLSVGYSYQDILDEFCSRNAFSISLSLEAETKYVVVAYAVNEEALKCSSTSYEFFETEAITPSDNIITLTATNITARTIDVGVTTTNNDPYVTMLCETQYIDQYNTNQEIIDFFVNTYTMNLNVGDFTETVENLLPETRYSLCAFGYNSGTVTTDLFRLDCETTSAESSNVSIEVIFDKYYDAKEVAELDPSYSTIPDGFALMPVKVITYDDKIAEYYYDLFATSYLESLQLPDDVIISQLVSAGPKPSEFLYIVNYDLASKIIAVAKDNNDNFGPLWHSEEFTLTKDGTSDPNEFISTSENVPSNIDENKHSISHFSSINQAKKDKSSMTKEESTTKLEELTKYIFNVDSTKNLKNRRSIVF